jgi:hypothetical protein
MTNAEKSGLRGGVRCSCGQIFEVIVREYREDSEMTNERKNITQPPDWWAVFEAEAKKAGVSLSEWIGEACAERLPVKIRKQLSERPPANRPPKAKD